MKSLTLDQLIMLERLTGKQHYFSGKPRAWPRTERENARYKIPEDHLIGKSLPIELVKKLSIRDRFFGFTRPPEYGVSIHDYSGPQQKLKKYIKQYR